MDLTIRPGWRRECDTPGRMARETRMDAAAPVLPMFVTEGRDKKEPIEAMPGSTATASTAWRHARRIGESLRHLCCRCIPIAPTVNARVNRASNILQKYYQKDFSPIMSKKDIEVKRDERIL